MEEKIYTAAQLVEFGNYLLKQRGLTAETEGVTHADLCNAVDDGLLPSYEDYKKQEANVVVPH